MRPPPFMQAQRAALLASGVTADRIHREVFGQDLLDDILSINREPTMTSPIDTLPDAHRQRFATPDLQRHQAISTPRLRQRMTREAGCLSPARRAHCEVPTHA